MYTLPRKPDHPQPHESDELIIYMHVCTDNPNGVMGDSNNYEICDNSLLTRSSSHVNVILTIRLYNQRSNFISKLRCTTVQVQDTI